MQPTQELLTVDDQFKQIMEANFGVADYSDPMAMYTHALGEMSLSVGTLSADDEFTQQALQDSTKLESLLKVNTTVGALGQEAMQDVVVWQAQARERHDRRVLELLGASDGSEDDNDKASVSPSPWGKIHKPKKKVLAA